MDSLQLKDLTFDCRNNMEVTKETHLLFEYAYSCCLTNLASDAYVIGGTNARPRGYFETTTIDTRPLGRPPRPSMISTPMIGRCGYDYMNVCMGPSMWPDARTTKKTIDFKFICFGRGRR
jgi:hypothetical protein